MRFKPKPLTVGTPVPALPSDVAGSLVVEWRRHKSREHADVGDHALWVLHGSRSFAWSVRERGNDAIVEASGAEATEAQAKRAAVLALARHLCEQRAPIDSHARLVDAIWECVLCKTTWSHPTGCNAIVDKNAGYNACTCCLNPSTRRQIKHAIAKAPKPAAEEVAKIVDKRPFKVGDRVRIAAGFVDAHLVGREGVLEVRTYRDWDWLLAEAGGKRRYVRSSEIEHAPAVAFESLEWNKGGHCEMPDGLMLNVCGAFWNITGFLNGGRLDGDVVKSTAENAKRDAFNAWLALPKAAK